MQYVLCVWRSSRAMPPSVPVFVIVVVVYCRTLNCNSTCITLFRTGPCVCVRYTRIPGCVYVCECMCVPVHASTALCGAMCHTRIGEYRHLCAMPVCVCVSVGRMCVCCARSHARIFIIVTFVRVCVCACVWQCERKTSLQQIFLGANFTAHFPFSIVSFFSFFILLLFSPRF